MDSARSTGTRSSRGAARARFWLAGLIAAAAALWAVGEWQRSVRSGTDDSDRGVSLEREENPEFSPAPRL